MRSEVEAGVSPVLLPNDNGEQLRFCQRRTFHADPLQPTPEMLGSATATSSSTYSVSGRAEPPIRLENFSALPHLLNSRVNCVSEMICGTLGNARSR